MSQLHERQPKQTASAERHSRTHIQQKQTNRSTQTLEQQESHGPQQHIPYTHAQACKDTETDRIDRQKLQATAHSTAPIHTRHSHILTQPYKTEPTGERGSRVHNADTKPANEPTNPTTVVAIATTVQRHTIVLNQLTSHRHAKLAHNNRDIHSFIHFERARRVLKTRLSNECDRPPQQHSARTRHEQKLAPHTTPRQWTATEQTQAHRHKHTHNTQSSTTTEPRSHTANTNTQPVCVFLTDKLPSQRASPSHQRHTA